MKDYIKLACLIAAGGFASIAITKTMAFTETQPQPVSSRYAPYSIYQDAGIVLLSQKEKNPPEKADFLPLCTKSGHDYSFSDGDRYLLAKIAMAEAEDESIRGKALVINVVLNRLNSSEFPNSIHDVIFQPGQFTPTENGRWEVSEPDAECFEAVRLIENGFDDSMGALYFEQPSESTWHRDNLTYLYTVGSHDFFTEKR